MRLLVLVLVVLFTSTAFAEEAALDKIKSFKCEFPTSSTNDWQEDAPKPVVEEGQKFAFSLEGIDAAKGVAKMVVSAGAIDMNMITAPKSLHFLEITPAGNLNITTVYDARTKSGKFKAVHSRHVSMLGGPLPSQSYGFCQQ